MIHNATVDQRLRRASARPMSVTVSGASTKPLRVMAFPDPQTGKLSRSGENVSLSAPVCAKFVEVG